MEQHNALIKAMQIISTARFEVYQEQSNDSPAWSKLCRVGVYLAKQAEVNFNEMVGA